MSGLRERDPIQQLSRKRNHRHVRLLHAVYGFVNHAGETLELAKILRLLCTSLVESFDCSWSAVWLTEKDRRRLFFAHGLYHPSPLKSLMLPRDHAFCTWLAGHWKPVLGRALKSKRLDPAAQAVLKQMEPSGLIPLHSKSRLLGFVVLGRRMPRKAFSAMERVCLETLGHQAAVAIERSQLTQETLAMRQSWDKLLEGSASGIFVVDAGGRITVWNQAMASITGLSWNEVEGRHYLAVLPLLDRGDPIRDALHTGKSHRLENLETIFKNRCCRYHLSVYPLRQLPGRVTGILGILENLSKQHELEERVKRTERLASVGKIASTLAHEVRNPLNAIKGAVTYLQSKYAHEPLLVRFTQIIDQEITRLNTFVENFLRSARRSQPRFTATDVNYVLSQTVDLMRLQAVNHNVQIEMHLGLVPVIQADPEQLRQVFINLCRNAIEAMPQGGTLWIQSEVNGTRSVQITFQDTGHGIPAEIQARLFEPFLTSKEKGTGLGLFIAREILESHGGGIRVHSVPGQGTRCTLTLPVREAPVYGASTRPSGG